MRERNHKGGIRCGIALLMLCHCVAVVLMFVLMIVFPPNIFRPGSSSFGDWMLLGMFFIGVTQFLYGVPLYLWLEQRRRIETMKGVAVGMLLTALLNGGCYVVIRSIF